ncbi:MAG: hypothetical protein E2O59_02520 [Gammaproteobacteria bacterium]|nr:MAG: hypothetical protein E2O59_02520 [Gammaproteobacteria bacterium]
MHPGSGRGNDRYAAVPVEAPRGSHIVFHGATVHGAYPKQTPGPRLTPVIYFRRIDW